MYCVRFGLRGEISCSAALGSSTGASPKSKLLLIGRRAAALATASPQHVHQSLVGGFQFRHALAKRIPLAGDDARGVHKGLVIAAKIAELRQHAILQCTQGRQLTVEHFVALFASTTLFSKERVIHDVLIIAAVRKTSRAKGSRTDAFSASVLEPRYPGASKERHHALSGSYLVTLSTLGRVQTTPRSSSPTSCSRFRSSASGVPARGHLEGSTFQTLRPNH